MFEFAMEKLKAVQKKAAAIFFDSEINRFKNGLTMVRIVVRKVKG